MKEVPTRSKWVGVVITCDYCLRSYEIEVGDEFHWRFSHKGRATRYFILPCGHHKIIPHDDERHNFSV